MKIAYKKKTELQYLFRLKNKIEADIAYQKLTENLILSLIEVIKFVK